MCEPVSIASAVALAAGTAMTMAAKNQSDKAQSRAYDEMANQQSIFRDAANSQWNKTVSTLERPKVEQELKQAQDRRTEYAAKGVTNFSAIPADGVGSAPKVITDAYDDAAKSASAEGAGYARRTGALAGYGDQMIGRNTLFGRSQQELDRINSFSRGAYSTYGPAMEAASRKGSGLLQAGELFQGLGNLGLMYGFSGPAGAAAPKPAGYPMVGGRPVSRIGTVIGGV